MISAVNVVMLPVKTSSAGALRVEARAGGTGALLWQQATDYITRQQLGAQHEHRAAWRAAVLPAAGGRVVVRDQASSATGTLRSVLFYSSTAPLATLNSQIRINTPLTVDAAGNTSTSASSRMPATRPASAVASCASRRMARRPGAARPRWRRTPPLPGPP